MATTCEHVAPGDLITAEFVNCLLDKIDALEKRVKDLESSQFTPDWKDYFNDLLKDYLKVNDPRLLKLLEGWLKPDDPRLTDRFDGLMKIDDPRLYKILEAYLKPGDIRIIDQIKEWLKPDDPWFEELLDGWMKIDDPRLQNVIDLYISSKHYVEEVELGKYVEMDQMTSELDKYVQGRQFVTQPQLANYTTVTQVIDEIGRYVEDNDLLTQADLGNYYTKDEVEGHFASTTRLNEVAVNLTNQTAALGMALFTGSDIKGISAGLNTAGKAVLEGVLNKAASYRM